jgi:hypothetical protein
MAAGMHIGHGKLYPSGARLEGHAIEGIGKS